MSISEQNSTELTQSVAALEQEYSNLKDLNLQLDLTRGKPCLEQVELSNALDGILKGDYLAADGTDTRNYGVLDGLPEAKALFAKVLGLSPSEIVVGGNSSLTMMYQVLEFALTEGLRGPESAWGNRETIRFICPVPGYDRHFGICEHLGIEMITAPMLDTGPDMDVVETLVREDDSIVGMWCVPRFSNPTGCVYDEATVARLAELPTKTDTHFLIMWDNAYAVHTIYDDAVALTPLHPYCEQFGTTSNVFQFGSTSKITFPGAGVAYLGSSIDNLDALRKHLSFQTIGPDKINQLRHVRFLKNVDNLLRHMALHGNIIRKRFDRVLNTLQATLGDTGMGSWTSPGGGYFISFDTLPGLATTVVEMAADIGVKLTPAGATFPYGKDPENRNIRLAPTFASEEDVQSAVDAFAVCVKLATARQRLAELGG
ncbi:MAG: aminotransferase class I/II-fold pyridoxal phosphate-dependent enzyme [Pseudomonadota bacterium]